MGGACVWGPKMTSLWPRRSVLDQTKPRNANNMGEIAWGGVFGVQGVVIWPFWLRVMKILGQFLLGKKKNGGIYAPKSGFWVEFGAVTS